MDSDDLTSEAMIGLWEAILNYRINKDASFRTFAHICIERKIINLLRTSQRIKRTPIPKYTPPVSTALQDTLVPKELLNDILPLLSKLERKILLMRVRGFTYNEIALRLAINPKAVDNGLKRLRDKTKLAVYDYLHKGN